MVGKDEIASPAVNVDRLPQLAQGQGRAFDVPARPAPTCIKRPDSTSLSIPPEQ